MIILGKYKYCKLSKRNADDKKLYLKMTNIEETVVITV